MISFKPLTPDSLADFMDEIRKIPNADTRLASDNLNMLLENYDEEDDCAVALAHGCLLARLFDGEYYFVYPLPLTEAKSSALAVEELRAYAVKEEIPLVISDVPKEDVVDLLSIFRHLSIDAADCENEFYTVRVMSEAALLDIMPGFIGEEGVDLIPFTPEDDEIYARLCKDEDTNKYWGYDYRLDEPDPTDDYFRTNAEVEFCRGVSICLAVRVNDHFAGEATLYGFDLKGGCECAVRLLPAFRHKGYATKTLELLRDLASSIGLVYLCATVFAENRASVRLTQKVLSEQSRQDGIIKFKTIL